MKRFMVVVVVACVLSSCGSSDGEVKYVALGASDATGIGAVPPTQGYVFEIQEQLDGRCNGVELFNLGIPGVEVDQIEEIEVPAAVEIESDLITLWTGSNDIVGGRSIDSFRSDLVNILMTLSADTDAKIFVANIPDLPRLPEFQSEPDRDVTSERVQAFNAVIENEVVQSGATLVDLSNLELASVLVSEDGFHPSNEGHEVISQIFLDEIIPILCP